MAKAPAGGSSLVNIQAELKKQSDGIASRIQAPTGNFIRITQDKKFKLPDGQESPGPLKVVILDFISLNQFYDRPFKKGEEMPPACLAMGDSPTDLVPLKESPDKQSEDCQACPNNQWGSNGKGKACSNQRLIAVVEANDDPESPILLLKVSPTGIKAFDGYVGSIKTQFDSLPISVETDIYFDPNLTYGSLRFGNPMPNKNLAIHFARMKAAKERLMAVPDLSSYEAPKGSKKK